ncbi:hypothetical protein N7532_001525 [Penicillium argentinense]|uniref:2-oxoacid dehydrogenase acyltransferase catalytic domain-containing protein n=1 Tax=Penicillium argentinense TaxID=1131581 RepID=A0A9W9G3H4_9EURO|nr:uncharacterized protein N7532_001525 [Penicillium argentinense]KAJ5110990.1 hypothetical protein N7532_001525 [Penicillium argentinense]
MPRLILKGSHNFGVAIDTPNGLTIPVVKDVQKRSLVSIAQEIHRLSLLAKEGALKPHHFTGANFTVSNFGSIGGNVVSPTIVHSTAGIVAIGKIEDVPALVKDAEGVPRIETRRKATLSWSADHRVLDRATVARRARLVNAIWRR